MKSNENTGEWTIARVKDELPNVKIKIDGKVETGGVRGSKDKFATVWVYRLGATYYSFSWDAVCRALNSGRPLKV